MSVLCERPSEEDPKDKLQTGRKYVQITYLIKDSCLKYRNSKVDAPNKQAIQSAIGKKKKNGRKT